jgi:hypothetical protein
MTLALLPPLGPCSLHGRLPLPDHLDRLHGELQLSALLRQMMAAKQEAVPQIHVHAGVWKEVARSRDVWLVNRTSHHIGLVEAVRRLEDLASLTGWEEGRGHWVAAPVGLNAAGVLRSEPLVIQYLSAGVR